MPSARELLEQADALMQKNRARVESEIPILMDMVAPSALAASAEEDASDVPVLTDIVDDVVVEEPSPAPQAIQSMPRTPMVSFEGDPSDWLVMDTIDPSMHSITGGAPDTLGVVPPFSPKAAGSARTPPPARSSPGSRGGPLLDPLGFPAEWSVPEVEQDDAHAEAWPMDDAPTPSPDDRAVASLHEHINVEQPISADTFAHDALAHDAAAHAVVAHATEDVPSMPAIEPASAQLDVDLAAPSAHAEVATPPVAQPVDDTIAAFSAAHDVAANVGASEPAGDVAHARAITEADTQQAEARVQQAETSALQAEARAQAAEARARQAESETQRVLQQAAQLEEERWHSLAEQISMQVLQRVDLFTDTGLKGQLADRLKPIVARASEELVGSITDHVGLLLRTYVAEAIEREIAAWRSGQR